MHRSFGNNVCIETAAEIDRIYVVAFQIAVHNRKENLQEQVDSVDKHCQQVQPCLTGHHDRQPISVLTVFVRGVCRDIELLIFLADSRKNLRPKVKEYREEGRLETSRA